MKTDLGKTTERMLLAAIAAAFFFPLLVTIVLTNAPAFSQKPSLLNHPWVRNSTLGGVTVKTPEIPFSWRAVATGEFQKSCATRFNESFAGREALIRATNEIWFRLFRQTGSAASTITVGRNDTLFDKAYLQEYFLKRTEKHTLAPWVKELRRLQDHCRKTGMAFAVVLSPSKPALYPEDAPAPWQPLFDPRPRGYDQLTELFREQEIAFVDVPALLAKEKLHPPEAPFFPKGGVHWNSRAVWLVANALHAEFRRQNGVFDLLEVSEAVVSTEPDGQDADLLTLMNLAQDWNYPVEKISIKPGTRPVSEQRAMVMLGGSFCWQLLHHLSVSRQYSEIGFFYYYRLNKTTAIDGQFHQTREPALPIKFSEEIFAADCLVLEINEASALYPEHHLTAFVTAALAELPADSALRPAFRSERFIPIEWEKEILFRAEDADQYPRGAFTGFSSPEGEARWTIGPTASIHLHLPPTDRDLKLDARVGALLHETVRPEQRVTVLLDQTALATWEFKAGEKEEKSLVIPQALVPANGNVALTFRIENPVRPIDLPPTGANNYNRELGLRFWSVRLKPSADAAPR